MVFQKEIILQSPAFDSIFNITDEIKTIVSQSGIRQGVVNVFHVGSTGSITTIEYEPGLQKDFPKFLNRLIPRGGEYHHDQTWHDGNGDGHLKASLIGPEITCPVKNAQIILGTWQQIILIGSDNKPRERTIIVTVLG